MDSKGALAFGRGRVYRLLSFQAPLETVVVSLRISKIRDILHEQARRYLLKRPLRIPQGEWRGFLSPWRARRADAESETAPH